MRRFVALLGIAGLFLVVQSGQSSVSAEEHAAVGAAKCKMCHKVEYASWEKSKHATADPKAECETCHGNGGDYWKMSVMKDPEKAKAAGLIAKPGKDGCLKCHKAAEFKDEMLTRVHDKKAK
jgi:nitrate/TMAO reductase-like tetraheme cytochrome c subunit